MKLIVGLGNPGPEYARTRHNAGFMAVDRLVARHNLAASGGPRTRFHSRAFEGTVANQRVLLLQPVTYMNRSGLAVGEAATFYKLAPEDVLIVVDDTALPCGRLRLRPDGSAGGHNGLTDVERALGTSVYPRLRLGVDAPGRVPQVDYVLGRFSDDQWQQFEPALDRAADAVECWLAHGIVTAMNRYNPAE